MNRNWMKWVLAVAAVYNLVWGAWVVIWPGAAFDLAGLAQPTYPQIWQCVGMIVGCYGLGYAIAATDPVRWWGLVLVGLLGKVLGPIGFVGSVIAGDFPASFGWLIVTNDLIWWVPFAAILWAAARGPDEEAHDVLPVAEALCSTATSDGESLFELSHRRPALVVCLRHLGCTFCREALGDLSRRREVLEESGSTIVLVHMSEDAEAEALFASYGLADVPRISDPQRILYRALGLRRGAFLQLFGPFVWLRGFVAGLLRGHFLGKLAGDGFQMPGVFLVHRGRLVKTFRHQTAADRPDYVDLGACPI